MANETFSCLVALAQASALTILNFITNKIRKKPNNFYKELSFFFFILIIGYFAISYKLSAEKYTINVVKNNYNIKSYFD